MSKSTIAVLGGSFLQSDLVDTALDYGLEVHILDGNANCFLRNHEKCTFHHINFSDENKVVEFCKKHNIDFVYAPCNEVGNVISSRIAASIGFQYNTEEVVHRTIDKGEQRKSCVGLAKMRSPKNMVYSGSMDAITSSLSFPMVVKPSNTSAGRGITGVENRDELRQAITEAEQHIREGGILLIEELIRGKQLSVETISVNGKHYVVGITHEIVEGEPLFIERCHYMNADIHNTYKPVVEPAVIELLDALGVQWGPCHIELKVNELNDVTLIEVASRMGGLRDRLMQMAGYPNYNELILEAYLTGKIDPSKLHPPTHHGLVNIMTRVDDLHKVVFGKRDHTFHSLFLYDRGPVYNPQNIMDAFGYAYFTSEKPLIEYGLNP